MVGASSRRPDRVDDPLGRRDLDDPAVDDVGGPDVAVRQRIGVVGVVQRSRDTARCPVVAVLPDDPVGRDVDPVDDLVRLVIGDDGLAVGSKECVVRYERLAGQEAASDGKTPDDAPGRAEDEDAPVATIGDEEAAGESGGWMDPGTHARVRDGRGRRTAG